MSMAKTDLIENVRASSDLSEKSKATYISTITTLLNKTKIDSINEIILNPKKNVPLLYKLYQTKTSLKTVICSILALFRYNPKFKCGFSEEYNAWKLAFDDAKKDVVKRYESNEPSERQKNNYVEYDEIVKMRDSLPVGDIRRLLLGIFTHLPPGRCEYSRVAIYKGRLPAEEKREANYIQIRGKNVNMYIREYKTKKHHDETETVFPEELATDFFKSLEDQPRDWLFVNTRGEPFTNVLFTQWTIGIFKKLFNKRLGVSLIRHSFINTLDFNTMSIREKRVIADQMKHSIALQDEYRLIFPKTSDGNSIKEATTPESDSESDSDSEKSTKTRKQNKTKKS